MRAASLAPEAFRPRVMGSVVAILVGLAAMSADGPTRHGHRLASESFRLVLDMEVAAPVGKTAHNCRDSRLDSADEPRQPVVGSTPHSRGTAQGGNRGGAIDGGQVSATAPEAAHADLTNIPDQSCGASIDFFTVPIATFQILFVFIVLSHARRRVVHFGLRRFHEDLEARRKLGQR
jgi:hypothetical protein